MAVTSLESGDLEASKQYFTKALALSNDPEYHLGLALTYLANEEFKLGWEKYEYRLDMTVFGYDFSSIPVPRWQGEDLNGKLVYILPEQGLGDTLHLVRFVKLLKQQYNVTVLLGCAAELTRLFQMSQLADKLCGTKKVPMHDYYIPVMSLPLRLHVYQPSQFMSDPYLFVDANLIQLWKEKIGSNKKIKVGICWHGNPAYSHEQRRACQLLDFLFLQEYPHIDVISLQKTLTDDERTMLTVAGFYNAGEQVGDFADTAAVIQNLDLVLTTDTSMLHLAGALGKTTWVMMSYHSEWRHPRQRTSSLWYNDVHLYRQHQPGDWSGVFDAVRTAFKKWVKKASS
jgi:hypothetical protein